MEVTVKRSIAELTRRLKSNPRDEAALFAVFRAVRDGDLVEELVALLEIWAEAEQGEAVPDRAMAELYFRIAVRSTDVKARELSRAALNLCPGHAGALAMFEVLADEAWTDELCARYQAFLEDAPFHEVAPRVRAAMIDRLVEAGHYEAARRHSEFPPPPGASLAPEVIGEARGTSERPSRRDEEQTQVIETAEGRATPKLKLATELP
jgi:hypothetical protein